jgi:hypothetical protein
MLLIARQHVPDHELRAGLTAVKAASRRLRRWPAASLDCACARRSGQPSGQSNDHERCALVISDEDRNMP